MKKLNDASTPVTPFVISRVFDAPRELVWQAWTEPERLKQWWGPKGAVVGYCKMDFRVGGMLHYCMQYGKHEIGGRQYYREISRPERLVFVNAFSDEAGGLTHHPMSPIWPMEMLTSVTFDERAGSTTVTIEWIPINATTDETEAFDRSRESMHQGWSGSFDQLAAHLAKG